MLNTRSEPYFSSFTGRFHFVNQNQRIICRVLAIRRRQSQTVESDSVLSENSYRALSGRYSRQPGAAGGESESYSDSRFILHRSQCKSTGGEREGGGAKLLSISLELRLDLVGKPTASYFNAIISF